MLKRAEGSQTRAEESSNLMSDTIIGCKWEEESRNLDVNDRVYQGPDTGSKTDSKNFTGKKLFKIKFKNLHGVSGWHSQLSV